MRRLIAFTLLVLATCAVASCVRHVDLRPVPIDAPIYHPDVSVDASTLDAASVAPDAPPDSGSDAM